MDFLDADNPAGQTLLILVARGSAIIAELLRLSAHIPSVFQGSPLDPHEQVCSHSRFSFVSMLCCVF